MIIDSVSIRSYRSIDDSGSLALGPVTVLIGRNNSGKSALLRAMHLAQSGSQYQSADRRLQSTDPLQVNMALSSPTVQPVLRAYNNTGTLPSDVELRVSATTDGSPAIHLTWNNGQSANETGSFSSVRPDHLFVPVFSRRKVTSYDAGVDDTRSRSVGVTDHDLTAWIHSLSGNHPQARRFRDLVERVLGKETSIGTFATQHGQQPGMSISQYEHVSLDRMGEGVSGVITILAELANPGRRVLLLEEPENDLHPEALRELLSTILEAVEQDGYQVVVSTHSDLVLRTLGSASGAIVYQTSLAYTETGLPTTTYTRLDSAIDRRAALAELGYDVSDPTGWLIFEESSAETFFLQVLIPHFAPELAGFRTLAAGGTTKVPKMVEDLRRFMLFVQKSDEEPTPRAWVIVDGDDAGAKAITKLTETFRKWPADRFIALQQPAIEKYYPHRFSDRVVAVETAHANKVDWQEERNLKGTLVQDVCTWFNGPNGSIDEVEQAAGELIELLGDIAARHADLYK